jgi:hypothetical protein
MHLRSLSFVAVLLVAAIPACWRSLDTDYNEDTDARTGSNTDTDGDSDSKRVTDLKSALVGLRRSSSVHMSLKKNARSSVSSTLEIGCTSLKCGGYSLFKISGFSQPFLLFQFEVGGRLYSIGKSPANG